MPTPDNTAGLRAEIVRVGQMMHAPVLGGWIADAVEDRPNPALAKFRWRPEARPPRSEEAARFQVDLT